MTAPTDNLVRANYNTGAATLRAASDGKGRTLYGHFTPFNDWTEIHSYWEGDFLERIAPGSFKRTFKERAGKIRVLYDHGGDPSIGNKPLGAPDVLREEDFGPYYESELFDAGYVNELVPALRASQLGASFRFRVTGESWVTPKKATDYNPSMLDERTITDVDLYEFGPVTFPAYDNATAGIRSGSDAFIERLLHDPMFIARYTERVGASVASKVLQGVAADGALRNTETQANDVRVTRTVNQRRALVAALNL